MRKLTASVFAICAAFTSPAGGEVSGAETLEWLACKADIIAVGQLTGAPRVTSEGQSVFADCVLRVTEMIKGEPSPEVRFTYHRRLKDDTSWMRPRVELLVFLCRLRSEPDADRQVPYASPTERDWQHHHLVPATDRHPLSIINLRRPSVDLFDREGRRLNAREDILKITRRWATSAVRHRLEREADTGSQAFETLERGSAVLLSVPAEERFRSELMNAAGGGELFDQARAAAELWKYPGAATEELLRALLDDTTEYQSLYSGDTIASIGYPIRAAAHRSLRQLGVVVADLPLERPATAEERRKLRESYWTERFSRALVDDWRVLGVREGATNPPVVEPSTGSAIWTRDIVIVLVEIGNAAGTRHVFALFPIEWPRDELPASGRLGIYALFAQGSRVFFSDGPLPEDLRRHLVQQFELREQP